MKFEETNPNFSWVVYTSGADEDSLDDQEARCRKVARDILGITNEPARVWRETITENDADHRPALEDMLQGAGSGKFRDLIVPSPNQLSGDVGEFVDICNRLNNAWIRVHFAEGPRSDFPDVGLLPYLRNIMDMQQREELSRRIRRGLEHSARQGRLPTGTAPFGYYYDPNTRSRKVNETEAERARHMFRMASDGMTSGEIARTLNRDGVTARHGKRWTNAAVTRILRKRSVVGIDHWKHIRIDTFTPPIVDKTLFDQVQEKLEGNREVPNPLSGRTLCRVRCGRCHRLMLGINCKKGLRYYRCPEDATSCKARLISAEALEDAVWNYVVGIIKDPAGTVEDSRCENGAMTAEKEHRIIDFCGQLALMLDCLDLQGKKLLLAHLGIRVELEKRADGIKIRVELNLNDGGNPPGAD